MQFAAVKELGDVGQDHVVGVIDTVFFRVGDLENVVPVKAKDAVASVFKFWAMIQKWLRSSPNAATARTLKVMLRKARTTAMPPTIDPFQLRTGQVGVLAKVTWDGYEPAAKFTFGNFEEDGVFIHANAWEGADSTSFFVLGVKGDWASGDKVALPQVFEVVGVRMDWRVLRPVPAEVLAKAAATAIK